MADKSSPPAQVRIGHYLLGDTLGVGTFGKVKSKLFCYILDPMTAMHVDYDICNFECEHL